MTHNRRHTHISVCVCVCLHGADPQPDAPVRPQRSSRDAPPLSLFTPVKATRQGRPVYPFFLQPVSQQELMLYTGWWLRRVRPLSPSLITSVFLAHLSCVCAANRNSYIWLLTHTVRWHLAALLNSEVTKKYRPDRRSIPLTSRSWDLAWLLVDFCLLNALETCFLILRDTLKGKGDRREKRSWPEEIKKW